MRKYSRVELKILFLECEDIITKSDSDFSDSQNDNDVSNDGFTSFTFG